MLKICYLSDYEINIRWLIEVTKLVSKNKNFLDIPVAAIIVNKYGVRCSDGINEVNKNCDPTSHAEIVSIRKLSKKIGKIKFKGNSMYITMKPCWMCLSAILITLISKVFYILIPEKIWPTFKKKDHIKLLNWINNSSIIEEKIGLLSLNRIYDNKLNNFILKNMQDYFINLRK